MDKKILYCASTASHIMNFHLPYLEYFKAQGWQVDVVIGGRTKSIPFADHVIGIPLEKNLWTVSNLQSVRIVQRLLAENSYDLISTHTALAGAVIRLAVKMTEKKNCGKVVHTSHGYFFNGKSGLLKRAYLEVERYLSPVTDILMVMNEVDYQLATQYELGKIIVRIPGMGIDLSRFSNVNSEEKKRLKIDAGYRETDFLIVYAAEMSKRKNQGELIRAFAMMSPQEMSVKLLLAGEGILKKEYEKMAQRFGVGEYISFLGHVSDMASLYKICDIAVSTSKSEGLPFNVMEAMACGLPVVASEVKGHIDLLGEGQSSQLYRLGDEKELAFIMRKFLNDKLLCTKLGVRNRKTVLGYHIDKVKPLIEEIYGE
ncbi:glycosyltransferase [Desulfitobacterium hafniense]|uniref:Glycosyl transferase group 1 n=1 Tax=Desulfitobacterium hafniense (strain Y51) TaxID=138119 RepID=Q24S82_DESHY|nr:glycosyltransferase [Desulfitobacterium hafniense]BAE85110.1 hypothetical protein DSY3321 [Desulfitobacterium hafniense Y51]